MREIKLTRKARKQRASCKVKLSARYHADRTLPKRHWPTETSVGFVHEFSWCFCCPGEGEGEDLTWEREVQGGFLYGVCVTWGTPSFRTSRQRRARLVGAWIKSGRQRASQGSLFSRLCCAVDANSRINAVRCCIAGSEGVPGDRTSASGSAEVLQRKRLDAVPRVSETAPRKRGYCLSQARWSGCRCFQCVAFSLQPDKPCSLTMKSLFMGSQLP